MFSGIAQRVRDWNAVRKFNQSVIGMALQSHTHTFFNETMLRTLSKKAKQDHVLRFMDRVGEITKAENPFLAYRKELAQAAYAYADFQVLVLLPNEKVGLFDSRYISAELSLFIRASAKTDKHIEKIIWQHPDATDDELYWTLNAEAVLCLYHLNVLNMVRSEFERRELNDPKDWFKPLVKSCLIFCESYRRNDLGLPTLCPDDVFPLQHGTFVSIVEKGYQQPLFEWERQYGLVHADVS
jgi:hypothetical protein